MLRMDRRNSTDSNNSNNNAGDSSWSFGDYAKLIGGIAAVTAGGIGAYLMSGSEKKEEKPQSASQPDAPKKKEIKTQSAQPVAPKPGSSGLSSLVSLLETVEASISQTQSNVTSTNRRGVPKSSVPNNPAITNTNALLNDIYLRYIALNDEDFVTYYEVMDDIFRQLHNKMKEADPYYNRYSSTVRYAGSHPDRLRIKKPDEFDIDIVIGLPVSFDENKNDPANSDIVIEPKNPGFVQLKMGVQFQQLHMRDNSDWQINKAAYKWKDEKNYLLQFNFINWWKGVVNRALDQFKPNLGSDPLFYVRGVPYTITKSESGPAMTIFVKNSSRNFNLDVDLVPALRFPTSRWPICSQYRSIPIEHSKKNLYWMVVPKVNKDGQNVHDKNRSWRIAMHEHEVFLMHDTNHMRQAIRLLKKFRDAQGMNEIASYYIKTLFFWEAIKHQDDRSFWNNNPTYLFKIMLKNFHVALVEGKIPYFWNKNNNLLKNANRANLNRYAAIVEKLLLVLDDPKQYKQVAQFLLTKEEYKEYSKFLN